MVGCLLTVVWATGCPWGPIGRGTEFPLGQGDRIEESAGQSSNSSRFLPEKSVENPDSPAPTGPDDGSKRSRSSTDDDARTVAKKPLGGEQSEEGDNDRDRARYERILADDTWIRDAEVWDQYSDEPVFRWRYPAFEDMLVGPSEAGPILAEFVDHAEPVVAANAAIGLSRLESPAWFKKGSGTVAGTARRVLRTTVPDPFLNHAGDSSVTEELSRAIRNQRLDLPIRRAAAESLASLDHPSPVPPLRELLDDYSAENRQTRSFRSPAVHAELIRGLAWHVRPADDPRFSVALANDDADVKLAALRSWIGDRSSPLPEAARWLRQDRDWRVRAAALTAMARRPDQGVCEYLAVAVDDPVLKVRVAAIAGLGELSSGQSKSILENLLDHPTNRIRAEAVSALAVMNVQETVLAAAGDKSWQVRTAVARALSKWSDRNSAAVARELLEDRSCKVQQETVTAVAEWPLSAAGPILLSAMTSEVYVTRRSAAEQLKNRWLPASEFPRDGSVEQRAEVLRNLENHFRREIGFLDENSPSVDELAATDGQTKEISPDRQAYVRELLEQLSDQSSPESMRRETISKLAETGPELVALLERLAYDRKLRIPEAVYRDVLPDVNPVFEVLYGLMSRDVLVRRRAADGLAKLAAERPLRRLSMDRLSSLCLTETDPLVWGGVFQAVAEDGSETSAGIAYTAISHSSPEVRRLACRHLGSHARADHVRFLTPALEDSSAVVVRAAAEALGLIGHADAIEPLERLLVTANESLRVDVAIALARLKAPSGPLELERLSYSADESIRHRVAVAMGRIGDRAFTGQLIRLLDDRHTIRRAALESLPKVAGHDVAELSGGQKLGFDQRLELWKDWSQRQSGGLVERPGEVGRKR
jgi:HEAT repeat protein